MENLFGTAKTQGGIIGWGNQMEVSSCIYENSTVAYSSSSINVTVKNNNEINNYSSKELVDKLGNNFVLQNVNDENSNVVLKWMLKEF